MKSLQYDKTTRTLFLISITGVVFIGLFDLFSKGAISINRSTVLSYLNGVCWVGVAYSIIRAIRSDASVTKERMRSGELIPGDPATRRWAWTLILAACLILLFIISMLVAGG